MDMRISTFAAEHHHSEGESLDRVEFDPTGMQDATRSRLHGRIVLSVEQLNEVVNPAATEGVAQQSECHQTNEVKEVTQPEEAEQSVPIISQIIQSFSCWEKFYYAFLFGLLPTAWDIWTDVQFGLSQELNGDEMTAGFCYMFICLPALSLLIPAFVSRLQKKWSESTTLVSILYLFLISVAATSAMAYAFAHYQFW